MKTTPKTASTVIVAALCYPLALVRLYLIEIDLQGKHDALDRETNVRRRLDMRQEIDHCCAMLVEQRNRVATLHSTLNAWRKRHA